jgi:hypothetical protein
VIVVLPTKTFPVVNKSPGVALVKIKQSICCPETGGVIVATSIVPLTNVMKVDGAIVVVEAIVLGFGWF